jgi:hypothetical protein
LVRGQKEDLQRPRHTVASTCMTYDSIFALAEQHGYAKPAKPSEHPNPNTQRQQRPVASGRHKAQWGILAFGDVMGVCTDYWVPQPKVQTLLRLARRGGSFSGFRIGRNRPVDLEEVGSTT